MQNSRLSVLASYDGEPADPDVLAFFAATECTVDGVENLGTIVGTLPYRRRHNEIASKVSVEELETARRIPDIGAQTLGSLFAYSLQQGLQHHIKAQPPAVIMQSVKAVDEAGYRFIASLTDYDNTETPGGPRLSTIQKAVVDLPELRGGFGRVNHVERGRNGAYASGVASSIALARDTGNATVIRLAESDLAA